jgi:hypothetical protein
MDAIEKLKKPGRFLEETVIREILDKYTNYKSSLIEILDQESLNPQDPNSRIEDNSYLYAMYILAEKKEKEAFSRVLKLFSREGSFLNPLLGDIVLQNLAQILTSTFNGDISILKNSVLNEKLNEYIRATYLETITILTYLKMIPREDTFHFFSELFRIEKKTPIFLWSILAQSAVLLFNKQFSKEILSLFDSNNIDEIFLTREEVEEFWSNPEEAGLNTVKKKWGIILSAKEEMNWWANFAS